MVAATCHPEKKHKAYGLCQYCYDQKRLSARGRDFVAENNARSRRWYAANREKAITASVRWALDNRSARRSTVLKYRYGITQDQEYALHMAQNECCPICTLPLGETTISLDHDHVTGEIRGLLHRKCNAALGYLGDDIENVRRAVAYLDNPPGRTVLG